MRIADLDFFDEGGCLVVKSVGEIDLSNAGSMRDAIVANLTPDESALVFDLSQVSFLGSAGIRLVFQLQDHLTQHGQALRLVAPEGSPPYEALRLAGVQEHIPRAETVEEAVRLDCE